MKKYIVSVDGYWDPCTYDGEALVVGVVPETELSKFIEAILKKGYVLRKSDEKDGKETYVFTYEVIWNSRWNDHGNVYRYVIIEKQVEYEEKTLEEILENIPAVTKDHIKKGPGLYELNEE